jgi:hypothetical protein
LRTVKDRFGASNCTRPEGEAPRLEREPSGRCGLSEGVLRSLTSSGNPLEASEKPDTQAGVFFGEQPHIQNPLVQSAKSGGSLNCPYFTRVRESAYCFSFTDLWPIHKLFSRSQNRHPPTRGLETRPFDSWVVDPFFPLVLKLSTDPLEACQFLRPAIAPL